MTIPKRMSSDGRSAPDYDLLEDLSLAVEGAETFDEALQETIRGICETTAWVYGESWIPDHRGAVLRPGEAWHTTVEGGAAFKTASEAFEFEPGEGLPGRVWKTTDPEWIEDVSAEGEEKFARVALAERAGLHAAFGLPIVTDRRVVAVLVFFTADPRPEDRYLASIVSTLAVFGRLYRHKRRVETAAARRAALEATLEESPVGIVVVTADRDLTYVNDHAVTLLGWNPERMRDLARRPDEIGLVGRDGAVLSAEALPVTRVLRTRETVYDQWVGVPRASEEEPLWLSVSAAPILDGDAVEQVVVTFQDVSDRVAEVRKLEAQSRRLDEFASVLSHDLRSPLAVADGYLEIARTDHDSDELQRVADAHDRIAELIEDVLELARAGRVVTDREQVFLSEVVETAWNIAGDDRATLVVERGLGTVYADRSRLQELLENLFRNCLEHGTTGDASGGPGDLTVWVRPTEAGFAVDDDGPGVPVSERQHVFEVGYSGSDGTGLGLAIVRNIAEAHGWALDVTASPAGGARVEVRMELEFGE